DNSRSCPVKQQGCISTPMACHGVSEHMVFDIPARVFSLLVRILHRMEASWIQEDENRFRLRYHCRHFQCVFA
ncbi:hypothetical protein AAK899_04100, partial [Erysipelotrichaceae bacterium 51-3]